MSPHDTPPLPADMHRDNHAQTTVSRSAEKTCTPQHNHIIITITITIIIIITVIINTINGGGSQ